MNDRRPQHLGWRREKKLAHGLKSWCPAIRNDGRLSMQWACRFIPNATQGPFQRCYITVSGAMDDQTEVLHEFAKICWQLKIEHDLFCSLFDRGPSQADLLQRTAPLLFGNVYAIMRNQLFLGFCQITDQAGSGKRINLTTNFILEQLPWSPEVRTKLAEVNRRLMSFRKFVEPARSRRIAHLDLRAQMEKETLGAFPAGADEEFLTDLA